MARTVQARIEANKTSQGVLGTEGTTIYSREPNRRNSVFTGNLTWWTTDHDLMQAVREVGLGEVTAIKFFENRANGQSKGYAIVELQDEDLAMQAPEKLQELLIHNQKPLVMYAAKISPHQFEIKCNQAKSGDSAPTSMNPKPQKPLPSHHMPVLPPQNHMNLTPPMRPPLPMPGFPGIPPPPFPNLRPPPGSILPDPMGALSRFPPPLPGMPPFPPMPPLGNNPLGRPGMPGFPPPFPPGMGLDPTKGHLNPAFLQHMDQGGNMAQLFAQAAERFKSQAQALGGMGVGGAKQPTEEEVSDANQRNRAISSSAITRAMSDANSGDFDSAIDTLRMAITLIKQSVTAGTESSQILIQSLQDCLHGIEQQATHFKGRPRSSREHRSHEERMRSSHKSSKHHRDRSRERRR